MSADIDTSVDIKTSIQVGKTILDIYEVRLKRIISHETFCKLAGAVLELNDLQSIENVTWSLIKSSEILDDEVSE